MHTHRVYRFNKGWAGWVAETSEILSEKSACLLTSCVCTLYSTTVGRRRRFREKWAWSSGGHVWAWEKQYEHNRKTWVRCEQCGFDSVSLVVMLVLVV